MSPLPVFGQKPWDQVLNNWLLVGHDANGNNLGGAPDATKVDKDSVVAAATRIVASKLSAGDTQPAFQIDGNGTLHWGWGQTFAPDTNLYYDSANTALKTDNNFESAGWLYANFGFASQVEIGGAGGKIRFGSATDTNVYRSAAGILKTDGSLIAVNGYVSQLVAASAAFQNKLLAGDTQPAFQIGGDGKLSWGAGGSTAPDITLSRISANALRSNGVFQATVGFNAAGLSGVGVAAYTAYVSGDSQNRFAVFGDGKIQWGPGGATVTDTNLYRAAAGALKTDQALCAGFDIWARYQQATQVAIGDPGGLNMPSIYFGSAMDTNLYRSAANTLKSDGAFYVGTNFVVGAGAGGGAIYWGAATDTLLSRASAGVLNTNGMFIAQRGLVAGNASNLGYGVSAMFGDTGARQMVSVGMNGDSQPRMTVLASGEIQWGPGGSTAPETRFYRSAAYVLTSNCNHFQTTDGGQYGVDIGLQFGSAAGILLGNQGDTAVYRGAASTWTFLQATGPNSNWNTLTAGAFTVQSDRETKSDMEVAEPMHDRLLTATIYTYRRDKTNRRHVGLMADELPVEITETANAITHEIQTVDLYKLSAALLQTVQHLHKRLAVLEESAS